MRAPVERILRTLLARHAGEGHVHLNDLAEVIGTEAVSQDEIDAIVTELERAGFRVGEEPDERDVGVMREVLASARKLRSELGRKPTVDEIALDSGRPPHAVRRALEHAGSTGRFKPAAG